MINFQDIKNALVETGMAYQEMADEATQKVIIIEGEWSRDGSAIIKSTRAGWVIGSFPKTIPAQFDVPQTSSFNKAIISEALQAQYPDAKIIVKII